MIVWLDHAIFGSGYGIKSPFWDDRYYWLAGEFYLYSAGFGAQLTSFQWTHPKPQERRELSDYTFQPVHSRRRRGRVFVSWACTTLPVDLNHAHEYLAKMGRDLGSTVMTSKGRVR